MSKPQKTLRKKSAKKSSKKPLLRAVRFRIMPLTVTMLGLLFFLKVSELYTGSRALSDLLKPSSAQAADVKEEEKKESHSDEKKEDTKDAHGDAKKEEKGEVRTEEHKDEKPADAKHEEGKREEKHGEEASKEGKKDSHSEEGKKDGHGEKKKEADPEDEPKTLGAGKTTVKAIEELKAKQQQPQFTQTELDILQNLVKRREEIEKREKEFEVKSAVLEAAEKRINDKVAEMKTLQVELGKVVEAYNKHQDAEIRGLVKIYETMKPGDAATIFNELEMPVLLLVIDKMSERKVAPVLAGMNPKRARDVTLQLAEMRRARANTQKAAATPEAVK